MKHVIYIFFFISLNRKRKKNHILYEHKLAIYMTQTGTENSVNTDIYTHSTFENDNFTVSAGSQVQ